MATSAATSQPAPTTSADLASVTKKPSFTAADVDPLLLYASLLDQRYLQKLRPMMSDRLGLNEVEPQPAKKSSRGWGSARNNSKQQTRDEKASPQAAEHYRTSLKESLMCLEQFMRTDGAEKSSVSVPFAFEDFIDGLEQEQAVRRQLAAVLNPGSSNQLSASESVSSVPLSLPQVLQTPSKPTRDTTSRKASRQVVGSAVRKSTRLKRATPERVATAKRSGNARSGAQEQPTPSKTSRKRKQPSPKATPKSKAGARTTRSGRLIDPAHPAGSSWLSCDAGVALCVRVCNPGLSFRRSCCLCCCGGRFRKW